MAGNRSFFLSQFRCTVQLHVPGPRPALGSDQCPNAITAAYKSEADLLSEFLQAAPRPIVFIYMQF